MANVVKVPFTPDIVAIGAYERDNFGDLLFWHAAKHHAGNASIVPAAPFPGTVDQHVGASVHRYADLLAEHPSVPVWVLGGEVGGTRLAQAAAAHPDSLVHSPKAIAAESRLRAFASPYMPREFPHPIVLNSVGLDGIRTLHGARLGYATSVVRAASYVSVREVASAETLRRLGVNHVLAPDAVHTLANWYQPTSPSGAYILFQMKGSLLAKQDLGYLATLLFQVAKDDEEIVIFAAGLAPGHDSLELYESLRSEILRVAPQKQVTVHVDPDPFKKVDLIAGARLWVGTSLHGLIISTALGVSSVSLEIRKLRIYANSWGIVMPTDVKMDHLVAASVAAREGRRISETQALAERLSKRASESIGWTLDAIMSPTLTSRRAVPGRGSSLLTAASSRLRILR